MNKQELILLINKHLRGETQPDEQQILIDFCESFQQTDSWDEEIMGTKAALATEIYARLSPALRPRAARRIPFLKTVWFRYAAAVLLITITGASVYFLLWNKRQQFLFTNNGKHLNILPGQTGAILTLTDGTQVVLDSLGNGLVATQNGTPVILSNGQLAYGAPEAEVTGMTTYNTMATPKGRQFQVVLPDGTKVWLNAASSLKYPTAFINTERRVEITGEAYFEVAPDKSKPFRVIIKDQTEVEVLGTSFNVNSYEDEESITTTLLEGSVTIRHRGTESVILKPGEEAQIRSIAGKQGQQRMATEQSVVTVTENADIEKAMAWRRGFFNFDNASLADVMRQLARWYDIEVVYEKKIPDIRFGGELSRNVQLSDLIKALEMSKVHFRVEEGRRLVVLP